MKVTIFTMCLLAILFAFQTQTFAVSFVVNQSGDAGDGTCDATCTLRDAVLAANAAASNDTISFAAGLTTVTLTNEIVITNNGTLSINGGGANVLTIDGGAGTNRIFSITAATVTITGVTLTGGNGVGGLSSGLGNAIIVDGGTTVLESVVVRANVGTGSNGAVFFGSGTNHRIANSTFSDNRDGDCVGFRIDDGTLTVTNSTFSGNQAVVNGSDNATLGGGFCVLGGDVTMRSSTVTENSSNGVEGGGGIFVNSGTLNLGNTIVAGNTSSNGFFPEIRFEGGTITSAGYNLVGDSAGDSTNTQNAITYNPTDILDMPPLLAPLADNNSINKTPTHALMPGSPAIDKGFSFGSTTDQRGLTRPVDNPSIPNATNGDGADIGAFEVQPAPTAASVSVGGRVTVGKGRGLRNARVTMIGTNGETRTALTGTFGYYRFVDVPAGETYIFSISSKRYSFSQQTQVRNIAEDTDDVNFEADNYKAKADL